MGARLADGASGRGNETMLQYFVVWAPLSVAAISAILGAQHALTSADHMSLLVIYPVLGAFCLFFLWTGIRGFTKRVIS
jgi:hypothetical protein